MTKWHFVTSDENVGTQRMAVPGGWLYKVERSWYDSRFVPTDGLGEGGWVIDISVTYVPDPL